MLDEIKVSKLRRLAVKACICISPDSQNIRVRSKTEFHQTEMITTYLTPHMIQHLYAGIDLLVDFNLVYHFHDNAPDIGDDHSGGRHANW